MPKNDPWGGNLWLRCASEVTQLGLTGPASPPADLLVDSLRVLLWLCSEQAPAPQSVGATSQRTVLFEWRLGEVRFEVEAAAPGRAYWVVDVPGAVAVPRDTARSGVLDPGAIALLRSLVPMSVRRAADRARGAQPTRGKPRPG